MVTLIVLLIVQYIIYFTHSLQLFDLPQQSTQTADFDQELLLYPGVGTYTGIDAFTQVNEKDVSQFANIMRA